MGIERKRKEGRKECWNKRTKERRNERTEEPKRRNERRKKIRFAARKNDIFQGNPYRTLTEEFCKQLQ